MRMIENTYIRCHWGWGFILFPLIIIACTDDLMQVSNVPAYDKDAIRLKVDTQQDWTGAEELAKARTRGITDAINPIEEMLLTSSDGKKMVLSVTPSNGISERQKLTLNNRYLNELKRLPAITRSEYTDLTGATSITTQPFGVFAYVFSGDWTGNETPNYWYKGKVIKKDDVWKLDPTNDNNAHRTWPNSKYNIRFFAHYPYDLGSKTTFSSNTYQGVPFFTYTVENSVASQKDILVADSHQMAVNDEQSVELGFKHMMSAIQFKMGEDGFIDATINKITLKNIKNVGNCLMDGSGWDDVHGDATYELTINRASNSTNSYLRNIVLTSGDMTLLLVPQTLNGARIRIDYTDEGVAKYIEGDINGTWEPGKTYMYSITANGPRYEWILDVTPPTEFFAFTGGVQSYRIKSAKKDRQGGALTPAAYYVSYAVDGVHFSETPPDWIEGIETHEEGSLGEVDDQITVKPIAEVTDDSKTHKQVLQETDSKGSDSSPFDLSMYDDNGNPTAQNTANCYVIHAPGVYKFPLVYGCAIKDGEANINSYHTDAQMTINSTYVQYNKYPYSSQSYILSNFLDHTNTGIYGATGGGIYKDETDLNFNQDPYIWAHYTPASASLVWQDAPLLIQNVELTDDDQYIKFKVDKDHIEQGNAVIAVKNSSGTIMWSWHIWVTDESVTKTNLITNKRGIRFEFMAATLGWCSKDPRAMSYGKRSCVIRVQQLSGLSAEFRIVQNEGSVDGSGNVSGRNTYYQHGRKDPMCPTDAKHLRRSTNSAYTSKQDFWNIPIVLTNDAGTTETILAGGSVAWNQTGVTSYDAPLYGPTGTNAQSLYLYSSNDTHTLGESIQKPNYFMISGQEWSPRYHNLWSANNWRVGNDNTTEVVKTIYDPSPVGFKMAGADAYSGFTLGDNSSAGILVNTYLTSTAGYKNSPAEAYHVVGKFEDGWYLYSDNGQGELVFLPANGMRQTGNGTIKYLFNEGHYWCATPALDCGGGANFCFKSPYSGSSHANYWFMNPYNGGSAQDTDGWNKSHAECIRPVVDKLYEGQ